MNFENMSYVQFISFIKETNRCPGGKDTINWILKNTLSNSTTNVLEIGSNTGFSSLEVARLIKCKVLGIDVSKEAVDVANKEKESDNLFVKELVEFKQASAYDIPALDNTFNLIIAGGSTSFMDDKKRAIEEMYRVLQSWGFLAVTNLFYHTKPPQIILDKVSETIGCKINYMSSEDWINLYTSNSKFELYKFERCILSPCSSQEIEKYIDFFMNKEHIKKLSIEDKNLIKQKWRSILNIFNENHKYLGFIRAILRKRTIIEEPELFKHFKPI